MSASNTLLDVRGAVKTFKSRAHPLSRNAHTTYALKDVSFSIAHGDTVGLVGESGSGKTTLARMIVNLTAPSQGEILYRGTPLQKIFSDAKMKPVYQKAVQIVFQDPMATLNPRLTIYQTFSEILSTHGATNKRAMAETTAALLRRAELSEDALNRYPHEFSGGQRQRIGIARALATNPELIILDEPVSALDISVQSQILNLLVELKKDFGLSYLFISHDLSVVKYLCDFVVVLYLGNVMELGTRDEIFTAPRHPYTQTLLESAYSFLRTPETNRDIADDIALDYGRETGCPFYGRCKRRVDACLGKIEKKTFSETNAVYCARA